MARSASDPPRPPKAGMLTPAQFAKRLPDISETTVRRMIAEGAIEHTRIGSGRGRIFIPATEVARVTKRLR